MKVFALIESDFRSRAVVVDNLTIPEIQTIWRKIVQKLSKLRTDEASH